MRRPPYVPLAAVLLPLLVLLPPGCGGDDGTGPKPEPCGIDITTPAPGAHFYSGDDLNLRWEASGGGTVRIELLKGGAPVATIAADTPNDGFYPWQVALGSAASGTDFALRVTSTGDAECTDSVALSLTNTEGCAISLTVAPDGPLNAGQDYLITWDSDRTGGTVDIELWKGPLQEKELVGIIAAGTADDGSHLWQNVDSFHQGTASDYYIRVSDVLVEGCEGQAGPYALVDEDICEIFIMQPVKDQVLAPGQQLTILFSTSNASDQVSIRLYALGTFVPGGYIADNVPAFDGAYTWTVTDFGYTGADNVYRIVIFDQADTYCVGRSETFAIR